MRIYSKLVAAIVILMPVGANANLEDNRPIIVRGTPLKPEQARQRAIDFVKSAGVANGQKQVARWVVPVCIKVIGVSAPQQARITDLMLGIAREADIPIARRDCEPNLTVTFAADAGQVVRHIHQRKPHQLREVSLTEREQLLNGTAPVRWWYATQMMDRDGVKENNMSAPWVGSGKESSAAPVTIGNVGDITTTQQYNSGSNVRTPTIRSLYGATVVVDAPAAGKTPIDSIAAYAAMVAFAEMDAGAPPPDSILGLFQPESVESSLTDWDMAFLKSLYRMPLDRRSRIQRGHLVEALLEERMPTKNSIDQP